VTCCLLVGVAPASALNAHVFSSAFGWHVDKTTEGNVCTAASGDECGAGEAGAEPGQFSEPSGVAVNDATGDVYVVDRGNNRVEQFSAAGAYVGQFDGSSAPSGALVEPSGIAVDNSGNPLDPSAGDVYVIDDQLNVIYKFSASGVYLGQIHEAELGSSSFGGRLLNVAIDANGDLWVYQLGTGESSTEIYNFNDALGNVFVAKRKSPFAASPGFAVDSEDNLYVNRGAEVFAKLNSNGEILKPEMDTEVSTAAAVDFSSNNVFIDNVTSIAEFSAADSPIYRFGEGRLASSGGVAVNSSDGTVYAADAAANEVDVFKPAILPDVTTGAASELGETTATLTGTVNPAGVAVSGCTFEYGTSTSYGQSAPCSSLPGSGEEPVAASASLTGLSPLTVYHYRLKAINASGETQGRDETFMTPVLPTVEESVARVTSSGATLNARLNPGGGDTNYRFEYGLNAAYGTSVPVPDGDAGSGTVPVERSALIEGLAPGTTYHYRVVAHNSIGTVDGADSVFSTQSGEAPGLLDGRAWEMVSPPDKHGAALEAIDSFLGGAIQAARNGGAISYLASVPVDANPAGSRSIAFTQVLSTRGSDGWASRSIATPNEPPIVGLANGEASEYRLFSDDLSIGLVEPAGETPLSPAASERTIYRREVNGEYTPLVTAANVPPGTKFGEKEHEVRVAGATPDLSHIVLHSDVALTAGFVGGQQSLYEWAAGSLRLVSVLTDGKPAGEEGASADLGLHFNVRHAISDDGSRIFWSSNGLKHHLYMRDMHLERTVQLDAAEEGAQGGNSEPVFQTASSDGSKVFFTDTVRLTKDATSDEFKPDLYMCEIGEAAGAPTCRLRDLTVDRNAGEAGSVQGMVFGASEDGRFVYFVADGVLAAGGAPGDCQSSQLASSQCSINLYMYDTVANDRRFIATLSGEDRPGWAPTFEYLGGLTARVSPDGRYLAFMSDRSLTGYDNLDVHSGRPDEEVFLYDVSTGRLVCASCDPSGARPTGVFDADELPGLLVDHAPAWKGHWLAASVPGWTSATTEQIAWHQSRYLSDSGRLFFNGADALVPRDTNGREDVYEYEPNGVGGCARSTGCVGLMSSGTSGEESAFLDASESGDEMFFLTGSRLVPQDMDGALDVYDARVCSASSPCLSAAAATAAPCASSDACRGTAPSQSEAVAAPASVGVTGAGNLIPPTGGPVVKGKRLTRAQKLASALRVCGKKPRHRRASCKARARRLYGSGVAAKRAGGAGATRKGYR
jgi:NHL repeat-containing protein/WD40 repeat protein